MTYFSPNGIQRAQPTEKTSAVCAYAELLAAILPDAASLLPGEAPASKYLYRQMPRKIKKYFLLRGIKDMGQASEI